MSEATVRLYHSSGAMCVFPITVDPALALHNIEQYLQAGFLPTEPEPMEGETVDPIGWVCRRSRIDDQGNEIPILDCYVDHPKMTKKFITVYINTQQQAQEFESLSGCSIESIPFWISKVAPERGESKQTDAFIVRLPHVIGVIHKPNPRYNAAEENLPLTERKDKAKPKRLFVGWKAWTGANAQQDDAEDRHPDPTADDPESELVLVREVRFTKIKGKDYLNLIGKDSKTYPLTTTKAFADAGYKPKEWLAAGGAMFDPALTVYLVQNGNVYDVRLIGEIPF